jgi:ATP-dependent DNA helicase 2 subunit 1
MRLLTVPCSIDNLRPPVFLFPSERDLEGSTLVFRALWERMLERRLCAICRFEARGTTAPKFVALFAEVGLTRRRMFGIVTTINLSMQKERLTEDNAQVVPPGFYAVQLPFADDVRNVTIEVSEADAGTGKQVHFCVCSER